MAYDSVGFSPGTGELVAVDKVDGADIQVVKLDLGAANLSQRVSGSLPVLVTPSFGALTNRSGTITTGGVSQTLAAVNAVRRYLFIQNVDPNEDLWFNFTSAATVAQPSIRLTPQSAFTMESGFISTEAVTVIAATAAHPFTAKEG